MALFRNVLKKGDTWCELYAVMCSDTSDDCANEIMAESVMSPQLAYVHNCDFLQCFFTSNSETSNTTQANQAYKDDYVSNQNKSEN